MTEAEALSDIAAALRQLVVTFDRIADALAAGATTRPQQDFVPRPDPEEPGGACPEHGTAWRLVPAGQSKKPPYKRYNAWWTCSTQGCNIKPGQIVESLAF